MKNLINYYYNYIIDEIRKIDNHYIFTINNTEYEFNPFYGDIDKLYKDYVQILRSNRYVHEIVVNKDKSIITIYDGIPYILIKKNLNIREDLNLEYIIKYDCIISNNLNFNWKRLWEEKIDYYEYQAKEIGFNYTNVKKSFNYYIGLSEIAISFLNYVKYDEIQAYISHKRINFKESISDFCNPLNIMLDSRTRDISEYIKINYLNDNIKISDVIDMLNKINFNKSEAILFLSRLIYPSYYFDMYDKIIQNKIDDTKLNFYIEKNVTYETFLRQIFRYLKYRYNIPEIEWLER